MLYALSLSSRAEAVNIGPEDGPASMEVHGFASQGFILTLHNDYLANKSTHGSFQFSEVGLNFTTFLSENLRMGVQLFAQDLGPTGNYNAKFDWFYLDYRWQDWLGLRVGRVKIPYGLYNEIQDADAARVPVLLPQSVYPLQTREILLAQTGAEVYGFVRAKSLGALEYRLFAGTVFLDGDALTPPGSTTEYDIDIPYVTGGRLLWETPLEGLRVGASAEWVRLEAVAFLPTTSLSIESNSLLWVGSVEYAAHDLVLTAEYSRWHTKQSSDQPALSPPVDSSSERAYAMATYRVTPWFHPGAYYSLFYPDVQNREGQENVQHDVALTLRFDINAHWLVKLEEHYMAGAAGLRSPLRANSPDISKVSPYWGAFFLKTTGYF